MKNEVALYKILVRAIKIIQRDNQRLSEAQNSQAAKLNQLR